MTVAEQLALVPTDDAQTPGLTPGPWPGLGPDLALVPSPSVFPAPRGVTFAQRPGLVPGLGPAPGPGLVTGLGLGPAQGSGLAPASAPGLGLGSEVARALTPSPSAYTWIDDDKTVSIKTTSKSLAVNTTKFNASDLIITNNNNNNNSNVTNVLRDDYVGALLRQQGDDDMMTPLGPGHIYYSPLTLLLLYLRYIIAQILTLNLTFTPFEPHPSPSRRLAVSGPSSHHPWCMQRRWSPSSTFPHPCPCRTGARARHRARTRARGRIRTRAGGLACTGI